MSILEELDIRRKYAEEILAYEKESELYNPKFPPTSEYYLVDVDEAYIKLHAGLDCKMVTQDYIAKQIASADSYEILYEGEFVEIVLIHKQSTPDEYLLYVADVSVLE